MLTILFVLPTLVGPTRGGVSRVTFLLTEGFLKRGFKVMYLINAKSEYFNPTDAPVPVYFFPNPDCCSQENIMFYHDFLKAYKVDFVINQWGLFGESKLYLNVGDNKCKTISVLHGTPMLNYEHLASEVLVLKENTLIGYLKLIARFFLYPKIKSSYLSSRIHHFNFLFSNSDMVCLLSESYIKDFEVYCKSFDRSKIISISNPNSFVPLQCKKKKQLLYVGRLDGGQKRPDRLLKIWKSLYKKFPDWEMIIVGDGKERRRLEESAKNLERISFVGFQSPEQYYHEASIFCMTSNFEGFPMVLPEAMSFGVVPFSFDSFPAVHDIIEDGKTGVLVKPFSIKEYADKLALLMRDEEKRNRMSENCMKDIARFSLDNIIKLWEILFNSLGK